MFGNPNENVFISTNKPDVISNKLEESSSVASKQQRLALIKSRRSLNLSRYMDEQLDWSKMTGQKLIVTIQTNDNPFVWLRLLFKVMRDPEWRRWNSAMQLILQKVQNFIASDCSIMQTLCQIEHLQQQLQYMCDLSCSNLQRHYLALLETLLKFNRMHCVVNEKRLCERMVSIARRFSELAGPVFWIIGSSEYTFNCLERALQCEFRLESALPLCSMLANFIVVANINEVMLLSQDKKLSQFTNRILKNSQVNYQLVRQLQLLYNNLMSKSLESFHHVVTSQNLLSELLNKDTEETWVTIYILLQSLANGYNIGLNPQQLVELSNTLKAPCPENLKLAYFTGNRNVNLL